MFLGIVGQWNGVVMSNTVDHHISGLMKDVIRKEYAALLALEETVTDDISQIVEDLLACKGRVVVSGVGKAGLVGRKISATLASTGTRSFWLDPLNALHGDLGMVDASDQVILVSNSGSSGEIILTAEALGSLGINRIAMTKDRGTPLAQMCEDVLPIGSHVEACPFNLAPTCSTTVMLALGDALAVTLQQLRGFSQVEYGKFHPAGALGRRLKKVSQCMRSTAQVAIIRLDGSIVSAVNEITEKRCGLCIIVDEKECLVGVFSDGDFRRCWEQSIDFSMPVESEMTVRCKSIGPEALVEDALEIMRKFRINALPVIDDGRVVLGMLDIQDVV